MIKYDLKDSASSVYMENRMLKFYTLHLRYELRLDRFTRVYDKVNTEKSINYHVRNSDESEEHLLLVLDLDDFKKVNDHYGHITGDKVISSFAKGLREHFHSASVVGRIGGDEFVIYFKNLSLMMVEAMVYAFCNAMSEVSLVPGGIKFSIGASSSIGVTTYEKLFLKAEDKLYKMKNNMKISESSI